MKPKLIHQEAMDFSFKAKKAFNEGNRTVAFDYYKKAAQLESQVAEFYFDKPEHEPTRSVMIRSAAFLNLKAGEVKRAQDFIFFGLLNTTDELIKEQLNDALEISVSLNNLGADEASNEYNYINELRQRSIQYVLEPSSSIFGESVSLSMIKDFTDSYLKSLKAYALSKFNKISNFKEDMRESITKEIDKIIDPLITNSSYGSFKFSIANDFVNRGNEKEEVINLKSTIVSTYHNEIFTNPLTDEDIENIKQDYSEEEINDIFRPLTKLKASNSPYKIGYYDSDNLKKTYLNRIANKQKNQLLPVKQITMDDIGELESLITHNRSSHDGKVTRKTLFKKQLTSYQMVIDLDMLEPKERAPILLNENLPVIMNFDSNKGFSFYSEDFEIEHTETDYQKSLTAFYNTLFEKIILLLHKEERSPQEQKEWDLIQKLINNIEALTK